MPTEDFSRRRQKIVDFNSEIIKSWLGEAKRS